MNNSKLPIALVDSGVGGISVLRHLCELLPHENYIYFGDSKNAPYGTKDKSEVLGIMRENLDALRKKGIKALVIACNTATSAAAKALRAENPDLPIIGIEPAIKPPAYELDCPRVLVMATPLTLREEKFISLVERYSDREEIIPLPCEGLVELIESGELDSPELEAYIKALLEPYRYEKIDALVLGCTHYPHVKDIISLHISPNVRIYDGGLGTAMQTKRVLSEMGLLNPCDECGKVEILNSSNDERLIALSKKLLLR